MRWPWIFITFYTRSGRHTFFLFSPVFHTLEPLFRECTFWVVREARRRGMRWHWVPDLELLDR